MTPRDFSYMAEGFTEGRDRERHLVAWQTANLMNCHLRKGAQPITAERLMRGDQAGVTVIDPEELRKESEWIDEEWDRRMRVRERRELFSGDDD